MTKYSPMTGTGLRGRHKDHPYDVRLPIMYPFMLYLVHGYLLHDLQDHDVDVDISRFHDIQYVQIYAYDGYMLKGTT